MGILKVVITAKAPLVFSERRPGGQFRPSTPYVPGTALRGALAQQMLDAGALNESDFAALFTARDAPLFRNAYPAYSDRINAAGSVLPAHPIPATAYSCKADSGFDEHGRLEKHGVFDSLLDRLCCEQLRVTVPYLPHCKRCTERVEAFGGFYVDTPGGKRSVNVPSQLVTRVALNRNRKAAEDGLLYSPLVISEATKEQGGNAYRRTVFQGSVVVNEANCSVVERRLPQVTHVGSGAARGFGWVEIKVEKADSEELSTRIKEFNHKARERWNSWAQLANNAIRPPCTPDSGTFFAVLLLSDAILRGDDGWTPTFRLEPGGLGVAGARATLLRCYATPEYRGGWHTGWGLPKDTELVARMGSVYVYHTPQTPNDAVWLNALADLEELGVGERRPEGFGQVRICDEFHLEMQEVKR